MSLFITVTAWLALLLLVSGIVATLLKPSSDNPPQLVAGHVIGAVALILLAVGMLVRADPSISLPLSLVGSVLAIISVVLIVRYRSA